MYEEILNTTEEAIFIIDGSTSTVIDVNRGMLKRYGYEKREVIGQPFNSFSSGISPYTQKEADSYIAETLTTDAQSFPWEAKKKDNSPFWVEVNLRKIKISNSNKVVASVRDVNKIHQMEKEIQQADKLRALGQMAGGIAHDFNNQLTGIRGFNELIQQDITPEEKKSYFEMIEVSVNRAADLTGKLLSFAR